MKPRHVILLSGVLAMGISVLYFWLTSFHTELADEHRWLSSPDKTGLPVQSVEAVFARPAVASTQTQLASTSRGDVDIPADLTLDAQGNLVADENLRVLMDFFLALDGERNADQIRALFLSAVAEHCEGACVHDAASFFDRYRDYLATMGSLQQEWQDNNDLRARLDAVVALRHQILGRDLASALFDYEEQYDQYRISQWEINHDASLSAAEQQQRLQAVYFNAPAGLIEREQSTQQLRSARLLQTQVGADEPATLYTARAGLLGADAAGRLQQLDSQRQEWDQRYQRYRQDWDALQASTLSSQDQHRQLEQLRLRHFSVRESLRIAALDRIHGTASP